MRFNSVILAGAAAVSLFVAGCGGEKKTTTVDPARDKVFQSASAEVKGQWDQAKSLLKSNDYFAASMALKNVFDNPALTTEQRKAVSDTSQALSDKMYEAARNGDEAANKALDELKKTTLR